MDMNGTTMVQPPAHANVPTGGSMMHMTFYWGDRAEILFSGWPGNRGLDFYLLALFLVAAATASGELLASFSRLRSQSPPTSAKDRISVGVSLAAFHVLRMGLLYLVMLAVMSFNLGVFIAALAGHALGFLFSDCVVLRCYQNGGGQILQSHDFVKC